MPTRVIRLFSTIILVFFLSMLDQGSHGSGSKKKFQGHGKVSEFRTWSVSLEFCHKVKEFRT